MPKMHRGSTTTPTFDPDVLKQSKHRSKKSSSWTGVGPLRLILTSRLSVIEKITKSRNLAGGVTANLRDVNFVSIQIDITEVILTRRFT